MPDTILTFLDNDLTMAGAAYGIASVNAAGDLAVVTTTTAAAEINWFPWDGAALGAKSTNGNPVGLDRHVAIHPIDDVVAIMNLSDRRVRVYNITGGALGTLIATSDAGTGASILGLRWAPDGSAIAVLGSLSPYVSVWTWDGAALGARVSPAAASVAPTSVATDGIAWSPGSDAVAYAIGLGDIAVSTWDGAALGAPSEPGGALTFTTGVGATGTDFSPDGTQIALCGDDQPFVAVYAWDGSAVGSTAVDVPTTTAGGGFAQTVRFGRQGQNIFLGGSGLDGGLVLYAYPWDGAVFGVRIDADTPPLAGAAVIGIALSPDNSTLFVMDTFEDLTVYATGLTAGGGTASGGTLTGNVPEGRLRGAGGTVVVDLTGDTFVADITPGIVQDIIDGMVGSGAGPTEWDNIDKPGATVDRISDTQIVITIPPLPGYDTDAGESITITLPGSALSGGSDLVLTPDPVFSITAGPAFAGGGPQPWQSDEREALRVLATAQGTEVRRGVQALEKTLAELLVEITGGTEQQFPTDADRLFDLIFAALSSARVRNVKRTYILAAIELYLP